jgi:hypothetical protein
MAALVEFSQVLQYVLPKGGVVMLKIAATIFGAAFLIAGLLGFVPATAPDGMLLGILHVNAAHNIVH